MTAEREDTFKLLILFEDGRRWELPQSMTRKACVMFCHEAAHEGIWVGPDWFPPHAARAIRTERTAS
jgi:hypothetical protein